MVLKRFTLFLSLLLIIGIVFVFLNSSNNQTFAAPKLLRTIPHRFFKHACDITLPGFAKCHVQVVTDSAQNPLTAPTAQGNLGPSAFHTAYNLPCTPGGPVASTCTTPAAFGPQIIAIVDAYNDPTVENDLNVYSQNYGLPSCTKANGCLTVVNQNGGTSLPLNNSNWALEISLDVQVAHMICQTCKILLVEANSNSLSDLGTAVNRAALMGATSISNSYGGGEFSSEANYDSIYFNHPGIAITASAGDSGFGAEYPAASPNVISVGGTTLLTYADNTYGGETVWNGTGSGCSSYETANSFQTLLPNWAQTGCGNKRAISDVSADADPNTGASIYDSTPYSGHTGWWIVGGTSLASPIIASEYALAGISNANPLNLLYTNYSTSNFHDVTSGSNGNCGTIMCNATAGFDGPTGLGSPNGLLAFGVGSIIDTPTPTPTSGPTPTPTDTPIPTATPTPTPIDSITPSVSITNPLNNSFVRRSSRVTITADANDNVGVTKVEFYVNGSRIATDTTFPYSANWNVPFGRGRIYNLVAKAYDAAGNVGTSSTVTVTSN